VAAFRNALEVFTREQLPQNWAETQNNLGNAFWRQGLRSEGAKATEVLAQAVTAYRCALEVRTREQLPQGWAATQNNLGCALQDQAARIEGPKGAELLAQAVAACRSALEVFTKADQPQDWARTQHNLAAALQDQAARPWYSLQGAAVSSKGVLEQFAAFFCAAARREFSRARPLILGRILARPDFEHAQIGVEQAKDRITFFAP